MTHLEKMAIYDEMCHLLTDYENTDFYGETAEDAACDFYNMLVKIQNNWDELISEEE